MLNKTIIGTSVVLDLKTRTLSRIGGGKSVTLPVSACYCLKALVEAKEEVLSQEQLMDIGWRNSGVEVTENSVRVMINKIRRALTTLEVQDAIQPLAVTRSGYRLVVRKEPVQLDTLPSPATQEEMTAATSEVNRATPANNVARTTPLPGEVVQTLVSEATASSPQAAPQGRNTGSARKQHIRIIAGVAGMVLGGVIASVLSWMYQVRLDPVNYVRWTGPEVPAQTEVWVPDDQLSDQVAIRHTLQLYSHYASSRDTNAKQASHLYITLGNTERHFGLIACAHPLKKTENNCESFFFRDH